MDNELAYNVIEEDIGNIVGIKYIGMIEDEENEYFYLTEKKLDGSQSYIFKLNDSGDILKVYNDKEYI